MAEAIVVKVDQLSDDLGVEQYDDNSLVLTNMAGARVKVVPKDVEGTINLVEGNEGICKDILVEHNGDGSIEVMNNRGLGVNIPKEEKEQFLNMLKVWFGSIRGTF